MNLRKLIVFLAVFMAYHTYATHIVGGSISLRRISGNSYELKLKVFRDCVNGEPEFDGLNGSGSAGGVAQCLLGMFDKGNNNQVQVFNMGIPVVQMLQFVGPNCSNPPNTCTQMGTYTKVITLNPFVYSSSKGYYFSYQRCCRNKIIQNINLPEDAGIAVYTEIPPLNALNSTPAFFANPLTYICRNNLFTYNFDFRDPDGDSLHYSLVTPLNGNASSGRSSEVTDPGPYTQVEWLPGFSEIAEIRGNPGLTIDPNTGTISVVPEDKGVFVVAIRVEEFRDGVKLGEVRLELQFNVTDCPSNQSPKVMYKTEQGNWSNGNISVTIPDKVCLDIVVNDATDSIYATVSGKAFDDLTLLNKPSLSVPMQFGAFKDRTVRFCWQTDCSLTGMKDQTFQVNLRDNACPIPNYAISTFKVHIDSMPNPRPDIVITTLSGDTIKDRMARVRIPDELCLKVDVSDPTDSLYVRIEGSPFVNNTINPKPVLSKGDSFDTYLNGSFNLCWQTACSLTGIPPQDFIINVKDNGGCIAKTNQSVLKIYIDSMPLINPVDMLCMTLVNDQETMMEFGDSTYVHPYFQKYNLYRAVDAPPFALNNTSLVQASTSSFVDPSTPDNRVMNYMYFIRTVNDCGFEGPPSDTVETAANHKPTPDIQKLLTVTVQDNSKIRVVWPKTWEQDFARYFVFKTRRGSTNFSEVADYHVISDTTFVDEQVNVHKESYCYYVVMKDTCQNYGPVGEMACSILLEGLSVPFESHLNWTPYTYWDNGTRSYSVFKQDLSEPFVEFKQESPSTFVLLDDELNRRSGKFHYYVIANQNSPNTGSGMGEFGTWTLLNSRSNEIELIQAPHLYVPNAFTANGDGMNDSWELRDVFVKDYELKIYNKWGQLVYTTTDKTFQWQGEMADGGTAIPDVYVYLVSYTGYDDSYHSLRGNVTLLK